MLGGSEIAHDVAQTAPAMTLRTVDSLDLPPGRVATAGNHPEAEASSRPPHALDLWGRCCSCVRWFYIQTRHTQTVTMRCPVCGAYPEQLENRAHLAGGPADQAGIIFELSVPRSSEGADPAGPSWA